MPYITVGKENSGDIDLYYEDHGTGDPIVLIHGWPLSGASWEKQIQILIDAGYRVITYDRRGFGNSDKPLFGYDYTTFVEDLHSLVNRLGLQDMVLVGFSMGGGEVARYIGMYGSERVKKAVFISAIPPFLLKTADNPDGVDSSVFEGLRQGVIADRPAFLSQFLSNFYNVDVLGGKLISDQAIQLSWDVASLASPKGTLDCISAWLTDFRKDLAHIDVPTLIVHGDSDRICPLPVTGERTHEAVKESKLVVVEDGPHGLNWTHAEQLNRALLDFLGPSTGT
ncbi:alpha/beta hydrolase fold protein [Methanosphaerula palustris E1-9c]|uniref:Alpha/beta hydrolase fold protein n=2 Tax=Methanosphaerula palustris TaxID=475088 RepID=B8GDW8_METPE|nr:alpha/beta hydrolase fold protein [Methanosphaerula palustris E1-9c]